MAKKQTYRIRTRNDTHDFTLQAQSAANAARAAVRTIKQSTRYYRIEQVTGDHGRSGYFAAYLPCRGSAGSYYHAGVEVHVQCLTE